MEIIFDVQISFLQNGISSPDGFVRSNGSLKLRSKKFHAEKFSRRTRHDHVQSYKKKKKNKKEKGKKKKKEKKRR